MISLIKIYRKNGPSKMAGITMDESSSIVCKTETGLLWMPFHIFI